MRCCARSPDHKEAPINQDPERDAALVRAARFTAVGFEFAGTVVAGVILGYYIDDYLGTPPLFTLVLAVASMVGAVYRLLWNLKQSSSRGNNGGGSHQD